MTRRPRRNHSPAFKAKVALAALKGDRTMSELTTQVDLQTYIPTRLSSGRINFWTACRMYLMTSRRRRGSRRSTSNPYP